MTATKPETWRRGDLETGGKQEPTGAEVIRAWALDDERRHRRERRRERAFFACHWSALAGWAAFIVALVTGSGAAMLAACGLFIVATLLFLGLVIAGCRE